MLAWLRCSAFTDSEWQCQRVDDKAFKVRIRPFSFGVSPDVNELHRFVEPTENAYSSWTRPKALAASRQQFTLATPTKFNECAAQGM